MNDLLFVYEKKSIMLFDVYYMRYFPQMQFVNGCDVIVIVPYNFATILNDAVFLTKDLSNNW